jgi:ABC-type lipoprotein release transport system permease subunit
MRLLLLMLDFALRDIRKSKTMFLLISVSIAVSASAILVTDSILLGFSDMLNVGNRGWMGDIVITPHDDREQSIPYIDDFRNELLKTPHIIGVAVRSYGNATLKVSEKWVPPNGVMGIDVLEEATVTDLASHVIDGRFLQPNNPPGEMVVGLTLADFLSGSPYDGVLAKSGDELTLLTNSGKTQIYTIVGVIDAKTFLPNVMAFLPREEVENVLLGENDSEVIALLDDPTAADEVRDLLQLRYPLFTVHTSGQEAGFVTDILETVAFISGSINRLLIFVVFLIVNIVIYISVSQRRRQIGIIKSMGATNFFVVGAYLTEAIIFGVIAYAICVFVYSAIYTFSVMNPFPLLIGDFRMVIDSQQMIQSFFLVLTAVFLGGVFPAWMAARTNFIDVLRNSA